jgi:hypothetical protein
VYYESSPFQGLAKTHLKGELHADWRFFGDKFAKETYKTIHYPVGYPVWLFQYGYDQQQHVEDLAVYWDEIHADYYKRTGLDIR